VSRLRGEAVKEPCCQEAWPSARPQRRAKALAFGHQVLCLIPLIEQLGTECCVAFLPALVQKGSACLAGLSAFRTKENGCYGQPMEQTRVCRSASI
jgi:hypothetical protein